MIRTRLGATVALLLALAVPLPADASLRRPGQVLAWEGSFFPTAEAAGPAGCEPSSCQERIVRVRLSARWWAQRRAALEFAIRWPSEYDDFDLHVFRPDGSEVPAARGRVGSAEVVRDRRPGPGGYRVLVVGRRVTGSAYEGAVQVEPRRRSGGRLPNLRTLPPTNVRIAAPAYHAGEPVPLAGSSCRPDETADTGDTRCLRFDTTIANVGRGELRMRFLLSGLGADQRMQQVIRRRGRPPIYRDAGTYVWHERHGHAHYEGFAASQLFRLDGVPAAEGAKAGFCLQDSALLRWRRRGNAATTFTYPACTEIREQDSDGAWGVMGISRGWVDTYPWDLPGQYVPIEEVPDGEYVLVTRADVANAVLESREGDNAAWARLRIEGDAVEVLASGRGGLWTALGG